MAGRRKFPERTKAQEEISPSKRGYHHVYLKDAALAKLDAYQKKHGDPTKEAAVVRAVETAEKSETEKEGNHD